MKAIIYHSSSKKKNSEYIAKQLSGDMFEIRPIKSIRNVVLQMIIYGYQTVFKKQVQYESVNIDFAKYDEIILVSPVWAGSVNAYMRQFLQDNVFHDKNVTIIGTSGGKNRNYFSSFKPYIDGCNDIVETKLVIEKSIKKA